MFGFLKSGPSPKVRAISLGKTLHDLVKNLQTQTFGQFVASVRAGPFEDSYIRALEKEYGFFETGPYNKEFSFHVNTIAMEQTLIVEGHDSYFGIAINGCRLEKGIWVDLKEVTQPFGKYARELQTELLKLPGFQSLEDTKRRFGFLR